MDMDKPLSQLESRMVTDWLRREKNANISNAFILWRKRPALAAEWLRKGLRIQVTAEDIARAAGREN